MGHLLIKRGHDGPARRCIWKKGDLSIHTPSLLGPADMPAVDIVYATYTRDEIPKSRPTMIILPSMVEHHIPIDFPDNAVLLIAPTLSNVEALDNFVARHVLKVQIARMKSSKIDGEHFALHIPSSISFRDLHDIVSIGTNLGVNAAVFHFDGSLGVNDLNTVKLRQILPCDWLSIAVGRIDPALIPVLYYLGFDIFDISRAEEASCRNQRLWRMSSETITSLDTARFCACHSCQTNSDDLASIILQHNVNQYRVILSEALHTSEHGFLRWMIESLSHVSPDLAAFLKRMDYALYDYIEEFTPTSGSGLVPLIGPESYNSPVVKRFRDRLVERYTPPSGKKIVLLLPCSARKPYSESRSHRRFLETIESSVGAGRRAIAETIITSPLGIIPRELERIYPVANYDLPVTGDWDAEEIQIASTALVAHMKKFPASTLVVAHVSGGYAKVVHAAEDDIEQTIVYTIKDGSASSRYALDTLSEVLQYMAELVHLKGGRPTLMEETLRATADFQFGTGAGDLLIPSGSRLSGKLYRTIICRVENEQTCAFIADSGLLSLTLDGGRRLAPLEKYWVKFDGVELQGGSLFSVAITDADPEIRPGDEVIVLNSDNEVVAVGRSEMSGREMCEFTNGRAVTIRHRRK